MKETQAQPPRSCTYAHHLLRVSYRHLQLRVCASEHHWYGTHRVRSNGLFHGETPSPQQRARRLLSAPPWHARRPRYRFFTMFILSTMPLGLDHTPRSTNAHGWILLHLQELNEAVDLTYGCQFIVAP